MIAYTVLLALLAVACILLRDRPAFHDAGPPNARLHGWWGRLWLYPWRDRSTGYHAVLPGLGALGAVALLGAPAWGALGLTAAFALFWELNEGYVSGQDLVIGWASAIVGTLAGVLLAGVAR